jgi:signal transduction histidine kinase
MVRALDPAIGLSWWQRFQSRLLGYLIALSCLTSVVAGGIYYSRQVKFVQAEQSARGQTLISNLAGQSELGAYSGDAAFLAAPVRRAFLEKDVSYAAVYNRKGEILIEMVKPDVRVDLRLPPTLLRMLLIDTRGQPVRRSRTDHDDLLAPVISVQGDVEDGLFGASSGVQPATAIGVARLGLSTRPAQRKLDEILRWGIYLGLIVLALGALFALFLARRISQPILALARGADEIRRGNLGYQLHLARADELGLLAESFNRMSSKLCHTVESLAHLNRNLEQEVAVRTLALRRSRDFIALLNAPLQLNKLLDTALAALCQQTAARAGAIYLKETGGALELVVSQGALASAFRAGGRDPDFVAEVAGARRPRLVEGFPEGFALLSECPELRAVLAVPVEFRDHLEAVLVLAFTAPPPSELSEFIEHASSQLGIAIANARAYLATERLAQELERRNVALLHQRDQLQEMSRLKSEFVASISHELRTPLNAIMGYTELIAEGVYGPVGGEQVQSLEGISENAVNLLQLINQILDLSKLEAGKMTITLEEVDLTRLLRDVVEVSTPLAKDRPYTPSCELPEGPLRVRTDRNKVRQILLNLLSNAIKFTASGGVEVQVESEPSGDVRVHVSDTGIGIRPENQQIIFDEFRQVDGSTTRKHGGSGLGLAISKKFATLLGGDILVESSFNRGSRFTLLLPRARIGAGSGAQTPHPELAVTIGESDVRGSGTE